jgi:hypothetical protein
MNAPKFVNAFMMLTDEGQAVLDGMAERGIPIPDVPAPPNSLIKPGARWLASLTPEQAREVWAEHQESLGIVELQESRS